jgi:glycosyltransferase involved in cell wall biosynthesis
MVNSLYICYFGLREPLVQTQVLPYLRELSKRGIGIYLLTFEPNKARSWTENAEARTKADLESCGIHWIALSYHKKPSLAATFYDVLAGARAIRRISKRCSIDILHARSHVPMAMAMLARREERLIFDIRGLLADEYVDAGVWREGGLAFKLTKHFENRGIEVADHLVVLTERMRDWLVSRGVAENNITVIPCCVDLSKYNIQRTNTEEIDRTEVVYAGSVTGLYLLEEMARFFLEISRRDDKARFRVLTKTAREYVSEVFRRVGIKDESYDIAYVEPGALPSYLRRAKLGLSFRKPTFSQIASSPTKIAEYLAAGIPVVSNSGVGDVDTLLERERVGVILKDFSERGRARAADEIIELMRDSDLRARCQRVARRFFDLVNVGGERYFAVYQRLEKRRAGKGELHPFEVIPADRER